MMLFGDGAASRANKAAISPETLAKVIEQGGALPLATVLRCRIRHFTDGAVLGTKAYVAEQIAAYQRRTGQSDKTGPLSLPKVTDWGDMTTLRRLRKNHFA